MTPRAVGGIEMYPSKEAQSVGEIHNPPSVYALSHDGCFADTLLAELNLTFCQLETFATISAWHLKGAPVRRS